jgi:hypothetical protein
MANQSLFDVEVCGSGTTFTPALLLLYKDFENNERVLYKK